MGPLGDTFSVSEWMLNLESHNCPIEQGRSSDGHHILPQLFVVKFGSEEAFHSRYISCSECVGRMVEVDIVPQATSKYFPLPEF